jgi:hypothetical protein
VDARASASLNGSGRRSSTRPFDAKVADVRSQHPAGQSERNFCGVSFQERNKPPPDVAYNSQPSVAAELNKDVVFFIEAQERWPALFARQHLDYRKP